MMIAASNNNHSDLPQTPRSLSKSHDDGDVKYFFQRPEQDLNLRQNSKWTGDDSALEQVRQLKIKINFSIEIFVKNFRIKKCGMNV